jgi:predicted ATPase
LIHIAGTSLFEDRESYAIYAAMMVMESTLTEGLSEFSATGLTIYAVTETPLGNYEPAYKYAQLALAMTRKYKCVETEVSTITLLSIGFLHWKEPVREIITPMAHAFSGCFASGNLWYGAVTAANMLLSSFAAGVNLIHLKEQTYRFLGKFEEYGQMTLPSGLFQSLK